VHVTGAFVLMSALAVSMFAFAVSLLNRGVGVRD
jgi:hypothetical protein